MRDAVTEAQRRAVTLERRNVESPESPPLRLTPGGLVDTRSVECLGILFAQVSSEHS